MCFDSGRNSAAAGGNPHKQEASIPPNEKEQGHNSNPQTSCCEAIVMLCNETTFARTLIACKCLSDVRAGMW